MLNYLKQLFEDALPGDWYVSVHVSDSIERIIPGTTEKQSIMFMCSIATKDTPTKEKKNYICLENARLVAVMHAAVPGVLKLMEAVEKSKDMSCRKALAGLKKDIEIHGQKAMLVGKGTWRDADFVASQPVDPEKKLKDPNLGDAERRKLRRKLRKQKRDQARARPDEDS